MNCELCIKENKYCTTCLSDNYFIKNKDDNNKRKKICFSDIFEEEPNIKRCESKEIYQGNCIDGFMKNDQAEEIFNLFKEDLLNVDYNRENEIIQTANVVFQISTLEDQINSLNPNISSIDLGKCENILKTNNNLDEDVSLIIVKADMKSEDLTSTYVQYEIYNPNDYNKLDLKGYKERKIVVNTPITLSPEILSLYDRLSELGYNLFDSDDIFYNDICSRYTSIYDTDMTLEDRKKELYNLTRNIKMCQTGCKYESYNKTTKKVKCNCDIQNESINIDFNIVSFIKNNIDNSEL